MAPGFNGALPPGVAEGADADAAGDGLAGSAALAELAAVAAPLDGDRALLPVAPALAGSDFVGSDFAESVGFTAGTTPGFAADVSASFPIAFGSAGLGCA
ncbi:hypothetical protein [Methylorubrum populi]